MTPPFARRPDPASVAAATRRLEALRGPVVAVVEGGFVPGPPPVVDAALGPTSHRRPALRWWKSVLPPTLRGGELAAPRSTVLALAAVVALSVLVVVGWAWQHRPVPVSRPVPSSTSAATLATPTPGLVVVDVAGKVRHPGLVSLPAGSRVADAIRLAGVLPGVDLTTLNVARHLVDGEQILVGIAAPAAAVSAGPSGRVDLNTATLQQLDALPGVGPVMAQRILAWRQAHGTFASVEQLQEVQGIGPRKYADLRDLVSVS